LKRGNPQSAIIAAYAYRNGVRSICGEEIVYQSVCDAFVLPVMEKVCFALKSALFVIRYL